MAILTISREYGSGGREIGRQLAQRLSYQYVDKERLFHDLEQFGQRWGQMARELDEVCPTVWERYDWQYRGYVAQVESLILDYAAAGRVVIIGRGSPFLLRDIPFCLRVRLMAPLEQRLERIMLQESLNREAAARLITQVDGERACFIKANYGLDWADDRFYDLTLNTVSLGYHRVVELLCEALTEKDGQATPEARTRLARLALAYRLKARVATDPRVLVPTLQVSFTHDAITISGIIHTTKETHIIQEIAQEICGETPVRLDLHHRV